VKAPARPAKAESAAVVHGVRISHPDRVVYPAAGITKLQIAEYYAAIGHWIVPHVVGRPLTLVHCARDIHSCVYLKHSKLWGPTMIRRVRIQEKTKVGDYMVADDLRAVIGLAQMGVVEIHTWNSTDADVERPNRIVWDLDPGPDVKWPQVVVAARTVRDVLQTLGLRSWVKTTGGQGLHVVAPMTPSRDWSECLAFARAVAEAMVRANPLYTTRFPKRGRESQILIDFMRNNRTNTSVAAFSLRARSGAPVSMPLRWSQLTSRLRPSAFTSETVPRRFSRQPDPWRDYWGCRQRISDAALRAASSTASGC
jgi:bifunctional non-homologous end joining protein LigD